MWSESHVIIVMIIIYGQERKRCGASHSARHGRYYGYYNYLWAGTEEMWSESHVIIVMIIICGQERKRCGASHSAGLHHHVVLHGPWGGGGGRGVHVPPPGPGRLQALLRTAPPALQGRPPGGGHRQHRRLQRQRL